MLESRVCRFTKYEEITNSSFSAWKYIVTARCTCHTYLAVSVTKGGGSGLDLMAFPHENPIISPLHPSSANASASSFHVWSLCPFTCDHRTRQRLDACKYTRALRL